MDKEGKDLLIVGHAIVNAGILCQVKGLPISRFWSEEVGQCRLVRLM